MTLSPEVTAAIGGFLGSLFGNLGKPALEHFLRNSRRERNEIATQDGETFKRLEEILSPFLRQCRLERAAEADFRNAQLQVEEFGPVFRGKQARESLLDLQHAISLGIARQEWKLAQRNVADAFSTLTRHCHRRERP